VQRPMPCSRPGRELADRVDGPVAVVAGDPINATVFSSMWILTQSRSTWVVTGSTGAILISRRRRDAGLAEGGVRGLGLIMLPDRDRAPCSRRRARVRDRSVPRRHESQAQSP